MTTETPVIEKKKVNSRLPKEPSRFKVIVCNDDVTPVEFVVAMLVAVFNHGQGEALQLTIKVHNDGSAVAGTFTYEIAEQKSVDATQMARSHGYPLVLKVEAE
jgi:ATP-dependent Clp protease adaptor protein ClpS